MAFDTYLSQAPSRCRFEWGPAGARRAASRGDFVIVVDTLSFSTSVCAAVSNGAVVIPCALRDDAITRAREMGAELAVSRKDVPAHGRFSLSPATFDSIAAGTRVVLPSLNGATCCMAASGAAGVALGCLVNSSAVAGLVSSLLDDEGLTVTIAAAGEREPVRSGYSDIRLAVEDYLASGAILSGIDAEKSVEAMVCEAAFRSTRDDLAEILWDSVSGRELRQDGFDQDVLFAGKLDRLGTIPVFDNGAFRKHMLTRDCENEEYSP